MEHSRKAAIISDPQFPSPHSYSHKKWKPKTSTTLLDINLCILPICHPEILSAPVITRPHPSFLCLESQRMGKGEVVWSGHGMILKRGHAVWRFSSAALMRKSRLMSNPGYMRDWLQWHSHLVCASHVIPLNNWYEDFGSNWSCACLRNVWWQLCYCIKGDSYE